MNKLLLLTVLALVGCDPPSGDTDPNSQINSFRDRDIDKYMVDGHVYIRYRWGGSTPIIHHYGCPCMSNRVERAER